MLLHSPCFASETAAQLRSVNQLQIPVPKRLNFWGMLSDGFSVAYLKHRNVGTKLTIPRALEKSQ